MFKKIYLLLAMTITFCSYQICFAEDILQIINNAHMVKAKNQQDINLYILKNYTIDRSKPDQLTQLTQTRVTIENLVFEEWKKAYFEEFTAKEREYLSKLYTSPLMNRFFDFNSNFAKRKKAQDIIKSTMDKKFKATATGPNKKPVKK